MEDKTYAQLLAELEDIVGKLRSDSCDIDTLAARTTRATQLLETLRSRLSATEEELEKILESLQ